MCIRPTQPKDLGPAAPGQANGHLHLAILAQILHRILPRLVNHSLDFLVYLDLEFFIIGVAQALDVRKFSGHAAAPLQNEPARRVGHLIA